jgi:hypothetical protein
MSIPQAAHWENLVRVELQTLRQSNYIEKWKAARMTHLQVLCVRADILTFNLRSSYPAWRFSVSNWNLWLVQSTWSNFTVLSWSARQWRFMSWSSTIVGHWRCSLERSSSSITTKKFILHYDITPLWRNIPTIPRKVLVLQQSCFILILKTVGNQSIYPALVEQWKFGIAGLAALTNIYKLRLTHLHEVITRTSETELSGDIRLTKMWSTYNCSS